MFNPDLHQVGYRLITVFCCLVFALLFATRRLLLRRFVLPQLQRCGAWLEARLVPEPTVDPLTEELHRVHRLQKLHADIARLQRILATDVDMSATRQLGNRLAYAWLIDELARVRRLPQTRFDETILADWGAALPAAVVGSPPQPTATVEILDVGWRT